MIYAFLFSLLSVTAYAQDKIVYGTDDRKDFFQLSPSMKELASSTAGMVRKSRLEILETSPTVRFLYSDLQDHESLCEGEKFSSQPTLPVCSGFLIAPDIIVTAGHCVDDVDVCSTTSWVFDYHMSNIVQQAPLLRKNNVYHCKKIIAAEKDDYMDKDYALIQLDRPVKDRKILKMAKHSAKVGDPLFMIGHPSGLPTKLTDNAQVKRMGLNSFKTNLDAFHGNSGSAVFNALTNEIVGILVRGDIDYRQASPFHPCQEVNTKPDYQASESVSHIAQVFNALIKHYYKTK